MKKFRVAMIGVGGISSSHYKMFSALPDRAEVIGMYDIRPEQMELRHKEWGYPIFPSREALLAAKPDVAWIMTPVQPRLEILEACFAAGLHCFTEKPLALNVADAEKAVAFAKKANRKFFVGQNQRNEADTYTMGKLFFDGVLGDLIKVYFHHYIQRDDQFWAKKVQQPDAWRLKFENCGGRIFEFSIHGINFLQWIGGTPQWVYGKNDAVSQTLAKEGLDDVVSAHVAFKKGYGVNETIMAPGMMNRRNIGIVGTKGECWLEDKKIRVVVPRREARRADRPDQVREQGRVVPQRHRERRDADQRRHRCAGDDEDLRRLQ